MCVTVSHCGAEWWLWCWRYHCQVYTGPVPWLALSHRASHTWLSTTREHGAFIIIPTYQHIQHQDNCQQLFLYMQIYIFINSPDWLLQYRWLQFGHVVDISLAFKSVVRIQVFLLSITKMIVGLPSDVPECKRPVVSNICSWQWCSWCRYHGRPPEAAWLLLSQVSHCAHSDQSRSRAGELVLVAGGGLLSHHHWHSSHVAPHGQGHSRNFNPRRNIFIRSKHLDSGNCPAQTSPLLSTPALCSVCSSAKIWTIKLFQKINLRERARNNFRE